MIQDTLVRLVADAVAAAAPDLGLDASDLPPPEISRPRQKEHGDWSTNVALVLASRAGKPPRAVAEAVAARLAGADVIRDVEVAGPGFINFFLDRSWLHDALREILSEGDRYGRVPPLGQRVQVEFVSANPTGPLHVGTARNAAIGDSLANLLEAAGFDVEREYYFNDAGRQFDLFGESVEARYLQRFGVPAEVPQDGYQGDYVADIATDIAAEVGDSLVQGDPAERRARMIREAVERTVAGIHRTLERFNVRIDTWFSEVTLHQTGAIDDAVRRLRDAGFAYDSEGAIFFASTRFGDDKDRVLIRSNGAPTYFAADCAYVLDKAGRGFDRLVYVWGADHHGSVKRLEAAAQALGVRATVEVVLYQLVSFLRAGQPAKMSRRAGDFISLDELLDEVGSDAARYTLLTRSSDSPLDFDIELVTRQSMDNPVYYVQYAHARVASLLRMALQEGIVPLSPDDVPIGRLVEDGELELVRKLTEFPEVVALAGEILAPHRLTRYAEEVAAAFHRFYSECRVITEDRALTEARLALATAAKTVVATALSMLGVSAPESMERVDGAQEGDRVGRDVV